MRSAARAATISTWRIFWSARKARSASRRKIELKLWPLMPRRAVGACHFGSFYKAMDAAQHIVRLKPIAVELVDSTMMSNWRAPFRCSRPTVEAFVSVVRWRRSCWS